MCLNPLQRPNPNRGQAHIGLNFLKDCDNQYIYVPCGHCPECISMRQSQLVQRVENESKYSYLYFCTLTYDNRHLPSLSVFVPTVRHEDENHVDTPLVPITPDDAERFLEDEGFDFSGPGSCDETLSDDEYQEAWDLQELKFPYADIHHIQLLLKNLRDNNPTGERRIRYVAVSELGKTRARPHFHILFFIEKLPGDDKFTPLNLEKPLRDYIKEHWAVNVGTRKNPIWEPRFTYRKRYYGGKLYQNFDLHWVNPNLTTEGVANVAFYVTKYMMKPSPKEEARQQFLKLNLQEEQYEKVWSQIKCRLLVSKGLGLDASFETVERIEYIPLPLDEYAKVLDAEDLPESVRPDCKRVVLKKRLMIPNFELVQWIHDTMRRGLKEESPHPIYVNHNGDHVPLCRYYQNQALIYTPLDAMDFWFNTNPDDVKPHYLLSKKEKDAKYVQFKEKLKTVDKKGDFDLLSTAMDTHLFGDWSDDCDRIHRVLDHSNGTVIRLGTDKL